MSRKFKISTLIAGLLLCLNTCSLNGQFLKDSTSIDLIKKGIRYVYNFNFNEAEIVYSDLKKFYPLHPATLLFRGMLTYWKNYPLVPGTSASVSFEADLRKCIDLCEEYNDPNAEPETLLINLCARGLLLLYLTDNNLSIEVFPIAAGTYPCIRQSFNFTSQYSDFYFFTGVYNYYREAYPQAHPLYKALAFLFPRGSKEKGLADLLIAAKSSIFLKAESYAFLTQIYLSYENNFNQATLYSRRLHMSFPNNPEYLGVYIKNLLLIGHYDEAEVAIASSVELQKNHFFMAQLTIFNGIIQEKKYLNLKQAKLLYEKGINEIEAFKSYGEDFAAFAYFGLSRICGRNGDMENKAIYLKLALKLTEFKNIDFNK